MAAVLRVKRRYEDEPSNALVIACKRRKTAENDEVEESAAFDPLTTVFKFAGTVKNQEDNVVEHLIQTLGKDELKANYKKHPVDILNKIREKTKQTSVENRYKVVNCVRSLDNSNVEEFEEKVTLIDVEDSISCANGKEHSTKQDESYVYDLYYGQTENEVNIEDMVSVHPFEQELVYDTYRDNGYSEVECESEDSNSESNWRNDYPDSDHSEGSIDDEDMREAIMKMKVEEGSDLSSEDDFVYAIDEDDVEAYGYKYAKYKAKMKKELDEDDSNLSEYSGEYIEEEPDEENDSYRDSD
ncbi:female sterile (2) ltoPP43 [Calliopsis andreniformis]|uniref:female sterile (2) ltoPP43 n=1 Tax=Calliopsis andreniformis TaxID=337506 RepID=UPI003FCDBC7D